MIQIKQILRQIEDLYIEEILLFELGTIEQLRDNCNLNCASTENFKNSLAFYERWKSVAKSTNFSAIEEVNLCLKEADCFFDDSKLNQDLQKNNKIMKTYSMPLNFSNKTETEGQGKNTKSKSESEQINLNANVMPIEKNGSSQIFDQNTEIINIKSQVIISEDTNKPSTVEMNSIGEPAEFIKCLERLFLSTQTVGKHLDNIQKPNKEFFEFEKQELKLNAIKQTLESLSLALKTSLIHRRSIIEKSPNEEAKKLAKLIRDITDLHQSVVQKYKEKNTTYIKNSDKWTEFNKDSETIQDWLNVTLKKVTNLKETIVESSKLQEIIKVYLNES